MARPPLWLPPPLPLWGIKEGERVEELREERQVGRHHPRGPGKPEPGLGEGDVGRRLLFQVPKTEVTTPAPCGAGRGQAAGSGLGSAAPPHPTPDLLLSPSGGSAMGGLRQYMW